MSFFLSSFFPFFLLSLNWEGEHTISILRKGGGRKRFKGLLSFFNGFLRRVFSLTGLRDSMELGLKASAISCPRALFRFFTRSFGDSVNTSCHTNCCPKTDILYSYFHWRKKATSVFRVLANHLASFFCQAIHSDYYMSLYPLLYPSGHRMQHFLAFILTWICYFGREELTYIPYSSFNGQSLAAC